ncbi:MAG: hypothetical protein ACE5KM_18235, partial [Planctomycetaceae bacterium]
VEGRVETSSDQSPLAWVSEEYGQLHGASRLVVEATAAGTQTVVTSIAGVPYGSAHPVQTAHSIPTPETENPPCLLQSR